jgi:RsmE family RNA methyltransferase
MNLILLRQEDFTGPGRVTLRGRRFVHIKSVLKAVPGETLAVGLENRDMGTGTLLGITEDSADLEVTLDQGPPEPLALTLVLALPRPKMLRRVLQTVTSLGVKTLYLVNSWRVEKSYWSSPALEPDSIRKELVLGLEQARDTRLPAVHLKRLFKPFVQDELPAMAAGSLALAAHPRAVSPCPVNVGGPVTLVVGPEGGFIDFEIETLEAAGCKPVRLGPRILRVETALPVLISRLFP